MIIANSGTFQLHLCVILKVFSYFADFHREIISEMGEMGVLGPTIKGEREREKKQHSITLYC